MDAGRRNNQESRMKEITFNIGDLLVGPAGRIVLITKLKTGGYIITPNEQQIYGYFNEENKESFLAYESDLMNMLEKGTWKHYRVIE